MMRFIAPPFPRETRVSHVAAPERRGYNLFCRPGDRGPPWLEESPDTAGQDAGATPGGESRRKVAQKGDRQRRGDTAASQTPSGARRTGSVDAARRGAG